jgi:hypothetical protein
VNLGIILTARCNASCIHCSKSYGPYRSEGLSREHIFRLMDQAAGIEDGEPLWIDLTGGEPFLDFQLLLDVVTHGAQRGAQLSCVTNAYWAVTPEAAHDKLSQLLEAGLTTLGISVSRFHQQFVPLLRVRTALGAAAQLGIATELKGAVLTQDLKAGGVLEEWKAVLDADKINIFPILPSLREGASLPECDYYREPGLPTEPCPGDVVCVYSDGIARSCCGPGVSGPFLALGDTTDTSLTEIHQRFVARGKQRILREIGPIHFAKAAISAGLGHVLRNSYAGPCDLCGHVAADSRLRQIADQVSSAFELDDQSLMRVGDPAQANILSEIP